MYEDNTIQHEPGDRWQNLRWPLGADDAETVEVHDATIRMVKFYGCRAPDGSVLCLRSDITEANGWRRVHSTAVTTMLADRLRAVGYATDEDAISRLIGQAPTKVDPRIAREAQRREIDAVLREDARRFPAFAMARRSAVVASYEGARGEHAGARGATRTLTDLHRYEAVRGWKREPDPRAVALDILDDVERTAYERARSL